MPGTFSVAGSLPPLNGIARLNAGTVPVPSRRLAFTLWKTASLFSRVIRVPTVAAWTWGM